MNHDSVDSRDERVPEKIGYLRVASVNVDSGHTATEPSEQNADSKLTGNFVKVQSRAVAPSLQSTLSINSYERYTMVQEPYSLINRRDESSNSLKVTQRELDSSHNFDS